MLGLRDIMDEPALLLREWKRKQVLPALEHLYDEIWVYGLEPTSPIRSRASRARRPCAEDDLYRLPAARGAAPDDARDAAGRRQPYVLVTVGGGDDGMAVRRLGVARVRARSGASRSARCSSLGPFMAPASSSGSSASAPSGCSASRCVTFDAHVELLMERAVGVVAMAGYNTFCEILSLDKRAILVPRVLSRAREQVMRAQRAADARARAHARSARRPHEPADHGDRVARSRWISRCHRTRRAAEMLDGLSVITDLVADARRTRAGVAVARCVDCAALDAPRGRLRRRRVAPPDATAVARSTSSTCWASVT